MLNEKLPQNTSLVTSNIFGTNLKPCSIKDRATQGSVLGGGVGVGFFVLHFVLLYFFPNEIPGLCRHRQGHSLGKK